jgi:retinol dehydrogenase-12
MAIPKDGMLFDEAGTPTLLKGMDNYFQSKVGMVWLGMDFARRFGDSGVLSLVSLFKLS